MLCEALHPGSAAYPRQCLSLARPDPAHSCALKVAASAGLGTLVPQGAGALCPGGMQGCWHRGLPWHPFTLLLCPHAFSTHGCLSPSGRSSTGSQ